MAFKGKGYIGTQWAYQERPVPSDKLNGWNERIAEAFELVHFLLNQAWGGGSGVIRNASEDDLAVVAADPPGATVIVRPGWAFIGGYAFRLDTPVATPAADTPTSQPRIDLVAARLAEWDVERIPGTEDADPAAPITPEDRIALAHLYLRPGMSAIQQDDNGTDGYIIDARTFL